MQHIVVACPERLYQFAVQTQLRLLLNFDTFICNNTSDSLISTTMQYGGDPSLHQFTSQIVGNCLPPLFWTRPLLLKRIGHNVILRSG